MNPLNEHLIALFGEFSRVTGRAMTPVSFDASGRRNFLRRVHDGEGFGSDSYWKVVGWFHENWPDGAVWPDGVLRPGVDVSEAAE